MNKFGVALSQRSTWIGLTALASVLGVQLDPEQWEAITSVGVAVGGLFLTFWKDQRALDRASDSNLSCCVDCLEHDTKQQLQIG